MLEITPFSDSWKKKTQVETQDSERGMMQLTKTGEERGI
jgi:hypothetical protein